MNADVKREIRGQYEQLDRGWQGLAVGYASVGIAGGVIFSTVAYWLIGIPVGATGAIERFERVVDGYKWALIATTAVSTAVSISFSIPNAMEDARADREGCLKRYLIENRIDKEKLRAEFGVESPIWCRLCPLFHQMRRDELREKYASYPAWISDSTVRQLAVANGEKDVDRAIPSSMVSPGIPYHEANALLIVADWRSNAGFVFNFKWDQRVSGEDLRIALLLTAPVEGKAISSATFKSLLSAHKRGNIERLQRFIDNEKHSFSVVALREMLGKVQYLQR